MEGYKHRVDLISVDRKAAKAEFKFELKSLGGPVVKKEPEPAGAPWWPWAVVGGGAAAIAGGVGMQVIGFNRNSDLHEKYPDGTPGNPQPASNRENYEEGYDNDVKPMLIGAYALYGLGAAAAITGTVLMFVLPGEGDGDAGKASAGPMPLPGGGGMTFTYTF